MDSTSNSHSTHPAQSVSPTVPNPTITKPESPAQTRPTITKSAIHAHFTRVVCTHPDAKPTDHARKVYVNSQLIPQFTEKFGMSDALAKAAVEEEMSRRYRPNPWDAPGPRVRRRMKVVEREEVREKGEVEAYGEEQWDLFEKRVGYK